VTTASEAFDDMNERMLLRLLSINPDCATLFGQHEPYDRLLPHGGFQRLKDTLDLIEGWTREAGDIASEGGLSRDQDTSLKVLNYTLDSLRFVVDDYPLWKMRPDALENPGSAMLMMLIRDYAPLPMRLESMAARIGELPRYLEQFRERFRGKRTVRMWTETARDTCAAFPAFLETVQKLSVENADTRTRHKMSRSVAAAKDELSKHEAWLVTLLDSSTDDFAMGRKNFEKMLKMRGISYTPEGLIDLATAYLEDYKKRRVDLATRISNGGTVVDARRIVESDSPRDMGEVIERTKAAVENARGFVIEQGIATVPEGPSVHVIRTPGFLEESTSSAATYLPAVFEKSQDTVYLVTGVKDQTKLGTLWNYPAIDCTAVHETYPGHHHQGVMSNRKPWIHQLPHLIYTPDTLSPPYESQEGWATYCELLMRDRGFLESDRHVSSLLDYHVSTACRTLSEVNLDCGLATVDEMVDFTARETGYPKSFAETDVKGFTRMPGYGICYLLGRHLVTSLKSGLRKELGSRFSEKKFHDLVAENGNLPFYILEEEVRWSMAGL